MITILLVTVFFYGLGHEPVVSAIVTQDPNVCMMAGRGVKDDLEKQNDVRDVEFVCLQVRAGNKG